MQRYGSFFFFWFLSLGFFEYNGYLVCLGPTVEKIRMDIMRKRCYFVRSPCSYNFLLFKPLIFCNLSTRSFFHLLVFIFFVQLCPLLHFFYKGLRVQINHLFLENFYRELKKFSKNLVIFS